MGARALWRPRGRLRLAAGSVGMARVCLASGLCLGGGPRTLGGDPRTRAGSRDCLGPLGFGLLGGGAWVSESAPPAGFGIKLRSAAALAFGGRGGRVGRECWVERRLRPAPNLAVALLVSMESQLSVRGETVAWRSVARCRVGLAARFTKSPSPATWSSGAVEGLFVVVVVVSSR